MKDKLEKAIIAHEQWKTKLVNSLNAQNVENQFDISKISMDNQCEFGKWLYSPDCASYQNDPYYLKIKELHAQFHKHVGEILDNLKNGNTGFVKNSLAPQGEYNRISNLLIGKIKEWDTKL